MVSLTQLIVPSAAPLQISFSANPNQLKTERLENNLAPLWRELADQLKVLFPDGDDEGAFIIPALDARSHVLSIKDRRNGVGKPVFKLASLGSGQTFTLVASELSVPGIPPEVVATCSLSSQQGQCVIAAFSPPRLFAAWRSAVSLFDGLCTLCYI